MDGLEIKKIKQQPWEQLCKVKAVLNQVLLIFLSFQGAERAPIESQFPRVKLKAICPNIHVLVLIFTLEAVIEVLCVALNSSPVVELCRILSQLGSPNNNANNNANNAKTT